MNEFNPEKLADALQLTGNEHLLKEALMGFIGENGEINNEVSFMWHFGDMLEKAEKRDREISNYRGEKYTEQWGKLFVSCYPEKRNCSGAVYGVFMRMVQNVLYQRHFANLPKEIE